MYDVSINKFCINTTEVARNVATCSENPTTIKVYIPKLMPYISEGKAAIKKESICTNIFVNAPQCSVNPSRLVQTQNFLTAKKNPDDNLSFHSKCNYNGVIPVGTSFTIEILNTDITDIRLTTK